MKLEQKPAKLNKTEVIHSQRTVKELEKMLKFVTSQIIKLQESGSQDERLFAYLNQKKDQATAEIERLKKGTNIKS